jgi:hypothetical protein
LIYTILLGRRLQAGKLTNRLYNIKRSVQKITVLSQVTKPQPTVPAAWLVIASIFFRS